MEKTNKKKIVFVLGMHRSGTSLTAELVSSVGFSIPGRRLDSIDDINAHGFWESQDVVDINERILAASALKWYHICPVRHVFRNPEKFEGISDEISGFLQAESEKLGDLVIKDPRLCLLWPLWFSAVDTSVFDIKVIFVNRHPSCVASSIRKRDGFSYFSSHLLWLYYMFSVFSAKSFPDVLVLNYDSLLVDNDQCVSLTDYLGVDGFSVDEWARIVDPGLRRNIDVDFSGDNAIFGLESRVYNSFVHRSIYDNFDFLAKESKEFEAFIFNSSDLIYALNESNNCIVESRSDLVLMGKMHSTALDVIQEKDFSIFENAAYIDICHARISELDRIVLELNISLDEARRAEDRLLLCNDELERNSAYIAECEGRIFNLEFSVAGFTSLRKRLAEVESVLCQKEADAERNLSHIINAENRIAELEGALVDFCALRARIKEIEDVLHQKEIDAEHNAVYIAECHARISELDDLFVQQRNNYLSALNTINQFEQKLANKNIEFFSVVDEFSALRKRLDGLLSYWVVRIVDRRLSDSGEKND